MDVIGVDRRDTPLDLAEFVVRSGGTAATKHPPSDGAHRLAWWLAPLEDAGFEHLCAHADLSFALIDRLLSGEVEPSDELAAVIARETEGAVLPEDWTRGGPLGWLDKPFDRNPQEASCR